MRFLWWTAAWNKTAAWEAKQRSGNSVKNMELDAGNVWPGIYIKKILLFSMSLLHHCSLPVVFVRTESGFYGEPAVGWILLWLTDVFVTSGRAHACFSIQEQVGVSEKLPSSEVVLHSPGRWERKSCPCDPTAFFRASQEKKGLAMHHIKTLKPGTAVRKLHGGAPGKDGRTCHHLP